MCPTAPVSNGSSMMGSVVAPSLGTIICFFMWLSPMTAVLEARRCKSLHLSTGPLNPIPFGITVMNCIAWTTYACQRRDYFILCANGTGLALGMFYVLSVLPCMDTGIDTGEDSEDTLSRSAERQLKLVLEVMIVAAIAVWTLVVMSIFIALDPSQPADAKTGQMVVSSLGVMMSTSYYASPLTTMYTVVKSRNRYTLSHTPRIYPHRARLFNPRHPPQRVDVRADDPDEPGERVDVGDVRYRGQAGPHDLGPEPRRRPARRRAGTPNLSLSRPLSISI